MLYRYFFEASFKDSQMENLEIVSIWFDTTVKKIPIELAYEMILPQIYFILGLLSSLVTMVPFMAAL